jgi:hypothetical protein
VITPAAMTRLRNVVLVAGLLFIDTIITTLFAIAQNLVWPRSISFGDWPGASLLLFLVAAMDHYVGGAAAGALAAIVLESPRKIRWVAALALLAGFFALSTWSFRWNWRVLDFETFVGWIGQAVLTAGAVLGAFAFVKHRTTLSR